MAKRKLTEAACRKKLNALFEAMDDHLTDGDYPAGDLTCADTETACAKHGYEGSTWVLRVYPRPEWEDGEWQFSAYSIDLNAIIALVNEQPANTMCHIEATGLNEGEHVSIWGYYKGLSICVELYLEPPRDQVPMPETPTEAPTPEQVRTRVLQLRKKPDVPQTSDPPGSVQRGEAAQVSGSTSVGDS